MADNKAYEHLQDERQQYILDRQLHGICKDGQQENATVLAHVTRLDVSLLIISSLAAITAGALNPLLTV